jgi:threonine aldolase
MIELRSDTFTKPTKPMLEAMFSAEVGDDVFGEDPTVKKLESLCAEMFGMEAALFCPSGTMTNQIAIKCHTQPGDEVICERLSHVFIYEGGGIAYNSGCQARTIQGEKGKLTAAQILENINDIDIHKPHTSLVSLENTSNRGGGTCYDFTELERIAEVCNDKNLRLHLDGARLWNAMVRNNESAPAYGKLFDSISVCLSKGLGTPVGSLLLGNTSFIQKAIRIRKVMGGGMRQAGYLAAAGIYALEHHINRLTEDHEKAFRIEKALQKKDFVKEIFPVETNMVIFEVNGRYTAQTFAEYLKTKGILCIAISSTHVRMVTHIDVTESMMVILEKTIAEM